ncbi:glycosyltransferase family 2 protein [Haloferula sargassicola]|uniref:Glycosyltransferase 2-like domain-containing protein n=1 Tax=Haloferula sargassicola TaxID=490096 RepID=A0ABP9UQ31_9BACT
MEGITVIVPVFNRGLLLREAVHSVLRQTTDRWELILVDDGSDSHILEECEKWASRDGRVRWLPRNREPKGAPTCRNLGIEAARFGKVMFLDSDDVIAPGCVDNRLGFAGAYPDQDFWVFSNRVFYEVPGDVSGYFCFPEATRVSDLIRFLRFDQPWITSGVLWNRSFLQSVGGWLEGLPRMQDWELNIRALLMQPQYQRSPGPADCFNRLAESGRISNSRMSVPMCDEIERAVMTLHTGIPSGSKAFCAVALAMLGRIEAAQRRPWRARRMIRTAFEWADGDWNPIRFWIWAGWRSLPKIGKWSAADRWYKKSWPWPLFQAVDRPQVPRAFLGGETPLGRKR